MSCASGATWLHRFGKIAAQRASSGMTRFGHLTSQALISGVDLAMTKVFMNPHDGARQR
jgi:hypothetical protein